MNLKKTYSIGNLSNSKFDNQMVEGGRKNNNFFHTTYKTRFRLISYTKILNNIEGDWNTVKKQDLT